jgi:hypothetical protein
VKRSLGPHRIDGYHLPGLSAPQVTTWSFGGGAVPAVELRAPLLSTSLLERLVDGLLEARETHLRDRPVAEIAQAIGRVANRLLDPRDTLRHEAALALRGVTGMTEPMAAMILDGMAADWREPTLLEVLATEFGGQAPGAAAGSSGPPLRCTSSAGTYRECP